MAYTQRFRKAGDASISLRASTPWGILDAILPQDHIVITPQRVTSPADLTRANLLALARLGGFTMVYLRRTGKYTLSGPDVSYWIGGGEGYPNPIVPKTPRSNRIRLGTPANLTTWLNGLFPVNGITLGTVTNTGTNTTGAIPYPAPVREALDDICQLTGAEWRINNDFTLDAGPSTTLYPLLPSVILSAEKASTEGTLRSVEAVQLEREIDASTTATRVIGYGSGPETEGGPVVRQVTGTPTGVRNVRPGGGTPDFTILADAAGIRPSGLMAHLTSVLNEYAAPDRTVRLTSRTFNASGLVRPGDRLWVWSPLDDLYDLANQITFRGQPAFPVRLRAAAVTTPITSEMGVYALINDGATIIDLSQWVEWEDGADTAWEVTPTGRKPGAANISTSTLVVTEGGSGSGGNRHSVASHADRSSSDVTDTTAGWTPVWTNLTVGTGGTPENAGSYVVDNDTGSMDLDVRVRLGNTGSVTGEILLAMPTGYQIRRTVGGGPTYGTWSGQAGGANVAGLVQFNSFTSLRLRTSANAATSATAPGTWAAGDPINISVRVPVESVL